MNHDTTLDFANAPLSPARSLVPSLQAYAQNGSSRRSLGDHEIDVLAVKQPARSMRVI
jgi:hypothetical protein